MSKDPEDILKAEESPSDPKGENDDDARTGTGMFSVTSVVSVSTNSLDSRVCW